MQRDLAQRAVWLNRQPGLEAAGQRQNVKIGFFADVQDIQDVPISLIGRIGDGKTVFTVCRPGFLGSKGVPNDR